MTVKDLISELESKVSALKSRIEEDQCNGCFPSHKYIALNTYEYCLDKLKEIKNS